MKFHSYFFTLLFTSNTLVSSSPVSAESNPSSDFLKRDITTRETDKAAAVREAFLHAWKGYSETCFGRDYYFLFTKTAEPCNDYEYDKLHHPRSYYECADHHIVTTGASTSSVQCILMTLTL
jgi:hypothetical protein